MSTPDFSSMTEADIANNPQLDQHTLMNLAQSRPELRAAVRQHPNCYPALAEWIDSQSAAAQQPQQNQDPQGQWQQNQAQQNQASYGGFNGQHGQAQQYGQAQQFGQAQQYGQPQMKIALPQNWVPKLPLIVAGVAVFAIIALFLPLVSASVGSFSDSASFFGMNGSVAAEGILLLVVLLATAAVAASAYFVPRNGLRLAYPIVGIVASGLGLISYIGIISQIGSVSRSFGVSGSVSIGGIFGIIGHGVLLATCIYVLVLRKKNKAAQGNGQGNGPAGFPGGTGHAG